MKLHLFSALTILANLIFCFIAMANLLPANPWMLIPAGSMALLALYEFFWVKDRTSASMVSTLAVVLVIVTFAF